MRSTISVLVLILFLSNCSHRPTVPKTQKDMPLVSYVDPMIGTGGNGRTYPGASMPFGMIQLSPDTRISGRNDLNNYQNSNSKNNEPSNSIGTNFDRNSGKENLSRSANSYVNPLIGTDGHGHTYPGASMPFGMMQLSPDTRLDGWDGCSGYHYSDSYIYGFSHTHLSGTGVSDYGDVLLMPTDSINFNNGSDGKPGYRAHFSHDNEIAEPGYYRVLLDSTDIEVELTVSYRSGIHKYSYPSSENQFLIIDLDHRDQLLDHKIQFLKDSTLTGFRFSRAWAKTQRLFYNLEFSVPIKDITYLENDTRSRFKRIWRWMRHNL